MKRFLITVFTAVFFSASVFAQTVTIKIATVAPARSPWEIELKKMAQEWTKITNGKVRIQFYDMTVLGGEKAGIQKLRSSRPGQKAPLDGAVFSTVGLHELAPKAGFYTLSIPFLIQSQEELDLVLKELGGEIEKEVENAGCKVIAWSNVGWLSFYTKDSYRTLGELKKIRMSVSGLDSPVLSDCLKISGFTVMDISADKFVQSLKSKNGTRGFFSVPLLAYAAGFYKDINYILNAKLCPAMAGFVISKNSWEKIPAEYHAALLESAARATKLLNDSLEETDKDCIKKMAENGTNLINPTKKDLEDWKKEFDRNAADVINANSGALNYELFKKIQSILETHRK